MAELNQSYGTDSNSEENRLQVLLNNKKLLVIAAAAVVIVGIILVVILRNPSTAPSEPVSPSPANQNTSSGFPTPIVQPTLTQEEFQAAIQEQKNTDEAFADSERAVKAVYPWIYNLPLQTDAYFVYFDLDKKVFIGLLYPKAEDDVEQLKAEAITQLKNVKNIQVENYMIEWTVNPR